MLYVTKSDILKEFGMHHILCMVNSKQIPKKLSGRRRYPNRVLSVVPRRSKQLDIGFWSTLQNSVEGLSVGITDKTRMNEAAGCLPQRLLLYGDSKLWVDRLE